jgi:hypothetical protein
MNAFPLAGQYHGCYERSSWETLFPLSHDVSSQLPTIHLGLRWMLVQLLGEDTYVHRSSHQSTWTRVTSLWWAPWNKYFLSPDNILCQTITRKLGWQYLNVVPGEKEVLDVKSYKHGFPRDSCHWRETLFVIFGAYTLHFLTTLSPQYTAIQRKDLSRVLGWQEGNVWEFYSLLSSEFTHLLLQ